MLKEKLEKKVFNYLESNNIDYYEGSIKYSRIKDVELSNNDSEKFTTLENLTDSSAKVRGMHVITYTVSVSDQEYDSDAIFMAYIDVKSLKLVEISGPQSLKKIEDTGEWDD